jgi:hypothetical protein
MHPPPGMPNWEKGHCVGGLNLGDWPRPPSNVGQTLVQKWRRELSLPSWVCGWPRLEHLLHFVRVLDELKLSTTPRFQLYNLIPTCRRAVHCVFTYFLDYRLPSGPTRRKALGAPHSSVRHVATIGVGNWPKQTTRRVNSYCRLGVT